MDMKRIIRVFPRRTNATPDDEDVRVGTGPSLFNDAYGLTQATIEGHKTMTRRLIPQEFFTLTWDVRECTLVFENEWGDFIDIRRSKYARYKVGEVVAVAQSYAVIGASHPDPDSFIAQLAKIYGVQHDDVTRLPGWRNKMFTKAELMPHRICITGIRAERLQDISDDDAIKEGILWTNNAPFSYAGIGFHGKMTCIRSNPRESFSALIDKVSGRGTWASNLWVVAYEYELVK